MLDSKLTIDASVGILSSSQDSRGFETFLIPFLFDVEIRKVGVVIGDLIFDIESFAIFHGYFCTCSSSVASPSLGAEIKIDGVEVLLEIFAEEYSSVSVEYSVHELVPSCCPVDLDSPLF